MTRIISAMSESIVMNNGRRRMAVDNPYFAVTQANGLFSLCDVSSGNYTLEAWHPGVRTTIKRR